MLRIVLGSYERLLYGLDVTKSTEADQPEYTVTQTFTYPAHIASIKTIAVSKNAKLLATGSSDEHVKLYSLDRNKESGTLFHHTGSITDLAFHETGYLFTASEDATIAIVRTSDWEPLKILKGHTTAIQSISIHPTGKLLLSVSIDGYLRTWDTAKASCAYTYKLPLPRPVKISWSKCGLYYAVVFETGVVCFQVATGKEIWKSTELKRLVALEFTEINKQPIVIVAGDAKQVTIYNLSTKQVVGPLKTPHSTRIKDLSSAVFNDVHILVTCSSDGGIYGWDLQAGIENGRELENALFSFDAKCRLTCCVATVQTNGKLKKSLEEEMKEMEKAEEEEEEAVAIKEAGVTGTKAHSATKKGGARVLVSYDNGDEQPATAAVDASSQKEAGNRTKNLKGGKAKILDKMASSRNKTISKRKAKK
ncbi:WD40-repeat-containing domain protein [Obelidium mucronatum]|nr:WD40-repeat-containing domain protein [Obelidium mucronatum]